MLKIGISGNIASGKSEVEKILKELGYKTICADEISHLALSDVNIEKQVFNIFQTTSREKLGEIVFSNKEKRRALESIIHPFVIERIDNFFLEYKDDKLLFAFVPLLFEIKLESHFDKIIFIESDDNIRLGRLIKNRGYTREHALLRINSQLKQKDKKELSNYVITNNSSLIDLKKQVNEIIEDLLK